MVNIQNKRAAKNVSRSVSAIASVYCFRSEQRSLAGGRITKLSTENAFGKKECEENKTTNSKSNVM